MINSFYIFRVNIASEGLNMTKENSAFLAIEASFMMEEFLGVTNTPLVNNTKA